METQQNAVAQRLGTKINFAERQCDSAIRAVADLLSELPAVRSQGGIGAEFGQPAVEHLVAAVSALGAVRGNLVGAHRAMMTAATEMDYQPFTGEAGGKPKGMLTPVAIETGRSAASEAA